MIGRVRKYENYPNLVGLLSKAEREVLMPDRQSMRVRLLSKFGWFAD
jgi:hypothetical protein